VRLDRGRPHGQPALRRPPGHHIDPGGFDGSYHLNNAALAAQAIRICM